ncbi:MAG TPA: pyridoxal phosphate-dependent aminotransferase [Gemmatimonadaceae bacterium]
MSGMSEFTRSSNIAELRESATIAASARAKALREAGRTIIDLGAGEPDMATPDYVLAAAHRALDAGATRYTAVEGILPLRQRIAERASELHGRPISPSQVVVSTGTKQALFNACFAIFGSGDEVLVPTPAWTSYYEMLSLARANAVIVRGPREQSFRVTPEDLEKSATDRTRGVMINSPCNPTGAVYSRDELTAIVDCCRRHGWWLISDEIYRAIAYERPATSVLAVTTSLDQVVVVDGMAKGFAMPGWRIGWSISSMESARAIAALQSHTTSNAATISQHAALAALSDPDAERSAKAEMVASFRRRRDAALMLLRSVGIEVVDPEGAFYLFIHVGRASADDPSPGTTFARGLLDSDGVAVVPGAAFHAPEWIRVSFAAPDADVLEGVRRIVARLVD